MPAMDSYWTQPSRNSDPFAVLAAAPRGMPLALLCQEGWGKTWLFTRPEASLHLPADRVARALPEISSFLAENHERRCVGWFGYDLRDAIEALPRSIADPSPLPVAHLAAYGSAEQWPALLLPGPVPAPPRLGPVQSVLPRGAYEEKVAAIVEHIRTGDIFQANLTQPFVAPFDGDPRRLFVRLCALSPAPFAAYLEDGRGTAVLSSSPEEFLYREGDFVRTRPIKGTRPRSADPRTDAALLGELLASEKDQAELTMIVDLLRNDLGKLAVPGSVRVGPFPEHASFAQVHHLFATVTARLRSGTSAVDLLRAAFPGGSITGAPKLRAMEILESLEVRRRGVYTGAIGWIGPGDKMHLNIAIRTLVCRAGEITFQVGGGVTACSNPAQEYEETLHKARGMLAALGAAQS